jgi:phospholipid/cholesterol/gamma-HCH transport system permease protein
VTLVLTYLLVHGFSTWGLPGFTRTVGQVFNPVIGLIFALKTFFFSLAVSIIPMVTTPRETLATALKVSADLTRLARLLAVILLIEVLSLVGNYY